MIEKQMIRLMLGKAFYTKYKGTISPSIFTGDISSLFDTIQKAHAKYSDDISVDELYSLHTAIFNPALTRAAKEKFSELVEDIKEILDSWLSWKWDIWESNKSTWTSRDQAIAETIDQILLKELDDRKAND